MIFKKGKIIFLHPGKTGGTSIEKVLTKKYLNKDFAKLGAKYANYDIMYGFCRTTSIYLHHADLRFYDLKQIEIPADYLKLVSTRCPYHKTLSAYYYNSIDKKIGFKDFIEKELENLISDNDIYAKNHFCSQVKYYNNNFNVIKLENIEEDCKKYNIILDKHHCAKTRARKLYKNYLDVYDSKMIDIINNLYKEDFLTFDYRMIQK
jgi:hypothetical protein